jgi:hypothetical protein
LSEPAAAGRAASFARLPFRKTDFGIERSFAEDRASLAGVTARPGIGMLRLD